MRPTLDSSLRGLNLTLTTGALTGLSGGATTYSTGATSITFAVNGAFKTKAQVSGGTTPTTDGVSGSTFTALQNGKACMFVWGLTSDGTVKVVQGPIVNTADITNGAAALQFPEIPDTIVPFAYHSVSHANATAFAFGTSNWNATGVTIGTVVNVLALPPAPLTSA